MTIMQTIDQQLRALLDERSLLQERLKETDAAPVRTYSLMRDRLSIVDRLDRVNYEIRQLQSLYP